MKTLACLCLVVSLLILGCACSAEQPKPTPEAKPQPQVEAAAPAQVPALQVPTLEALEATLKQYVDALPKLTQQVQQMQIDILILRGAIAREHQLRGDPIEEQKPEESKK